MGAPQGTIDGRRRGRRWRFGSAILDESSWTLAVNGRDVRIESKPLELLHELLLRAGETVSKNELLDAVWPEVSVVEASLPTAMLKLRRALGETERGAMIQTISRIGYRLAVPVEQEQADRVSDDTPPATASDASALPPAAPHDRPRRMLGRAPWLIGGTVLALTIAGGLAAARVFTQPPAAPPPVSRNEAIEALRALDIVRLRSLVERGWDPRAPLSETRDEAIDIALEACEWNPDHDRRQLTLVVRMLLDHGAWVEDRNAFGDTPYSIAKAPRYCGPNHPVTRLLHAMCYSGSNPPGDKCLATYERKPR